MSKGYNDRILRVDLSARKLTVEERGEKFFRQHLGGRGIVAHTLLKEVKPGIDPFGPENRLVFATGVATGHALAGSSRNSVGAKSPASNAYGESEAGGFFPAELKRSGFDAVIVEGKADTPVYLWLKNGQAEIRDASALWGRTTREAEDAIRAELGEPAARIAAIGPAGEKLARIACVMNDLHYAAGRGGMGAIMGSKNLKAVVARGSKVVPPADPERVKGVNRWLAENYKTFAGLYASIGTGFAMVGMSAAGGLPTRNFREGSFEGVEKIHPNIWRGWVLDHMDGCQACPIHCKRNLNIADPRFTVDIKYGGPEYETLGSMGHFCGVDDLNAISKANEICGANSLDTISTGSAVAFAMECFEAGILTEKDTDGLRLTFGNADAMVAMVGKIARREGLGDLLAEGTARAAKQIGGGAEQYAMQVRGVEIAMHEPRWKQTLSLAYAINVTGGDHCHAMHDPLFEKETRELFTVRQLGILEPMPILEMSDRKARLHTYGCLWRSLLSSMLVCQFVPYDFEQLAEVVRGVTGWNTTVFEVAKIGERNYTMARAFNAREGLRAADDRLPDRFHTPFESGPLKGVAVDREKFEQAKQTHYAMMGWDADGIPTRGKLAELDIAWVADEIAARVPAGAR